MLETQNILPQQGTITGQPDFSLAQVNIVLLLVLFFLVAGEPVATRDQSVELPLSHDVPLQNLPWPLLLLQTDGGLVLDGVSVTIEGMVNEMYAREMRMVHLLVPRDLPASRVIELTAELSQHGLGVTLVTLHTAEGGASR